MIYKTIDEWIEHNPNHRGLLPIEVCHQIWGTKDAQIEIEYELKAEEDDDIQDYKKPWVGLTEEELYEIYDASDDGSSPCGVCGACSKCKIEVSIARAIEAKLRSKNYA